MKAFRKLLKELLFNDIVNRKLQSKFHNTITGNILEYSRFSEIIFFLMLISALPPFRAKNWAKGIIISIGLAWSVGQKTGSPRPNPSLWMFDINSRYPTASAILGYPSGDALAYGAITGYYLSRRWPKPITFLKPFFYMLLAFFAIIGRVYLGIHFLGDTLLPFHIGITTGFATAYLDKKPRIAGIIIIIIATTIFLVTLKKRREFADKRFLALTLLIGVYLLINPSYIKKTSD
jgi:membrane-associated phospholipid phosphatase